MKIIGTSEISFSIEKIIKEADFYLILVTPFLKLHPRLKILLENKLKEIKHCFIVFREKNISKEEFNWLKSLNNVKLINIPNLHAKCYVSEDNALITSLNLYEYSQINNLEIGIVLDPKKDSDSYLELLTELAVIINSGPERIDFSPVVDNHSDFSMRKLYSDLKYKFEFPYEFDDLDGLYGFICSKAMKYHHFKDWELYLDKSAILRSTILPKEKFNLIYQELANLGKARSRPMF